MPRFPANAHSRRSSATPLARSAELGNAFHNHNAIASVSNASSPGPLRIGLRPTLNAMRLRSTSAKGRSHRSNFHRIATGPDLYPAHARTRERAQAKSCPGYHGEVWSAFDLRDNAPRKLWAIGKSSRSPSKQWQNRKNDRGKTTYNKHSPQKRPCFFSWSKRR